MNVLAALAWGLGGGLLVWLLSTTLITRWPSLQVPLRGLALLIWAWFGWTALVLAFQRYILYPAPSGAGPRPQITGALQLDVPYAEGPIEGWLVPGQGVTARTPGPVIIYTHGNAELAEHTLEWLRPYRARGWSVALLEYRGYGRVPGRPSQAHIVADAVKFYDQLAAHPLIDPQRVVFHGRSLGGGVAVALHAQRPAAALILESTFTSVRAFAAQFFAPEFLVLDPWPTLEVLQSAEVPVLIFHGTQDTVIPVAHGHALARAARHGTYIERTCGHNDCPSDAPYWQAIDTHLAQVRPHAR